ncbi:hypothetical protein [uncultured Draconibacterium sp.]|uniref:hypothetical protein n=1 Tax=uncultured Draconibacterium sp. TaxID=1573823 RepID=UPI002AA77BC7|nr:hypothetical protein [uncultured Draconibacterium sp.]
MRILISLYLILQFSIYNSNAQNIVQSLGGIETNFQIVSDNLDLHVSNQYIIQRAEKESATRYYGEASYGYGYGYQSYHLEFIAEELYVTREIKHNDRDYDKMELTFYTSDNRILASHTLNSTRADILSNPRSVNRQYFYSIDLKDVPVILLEQTAKIDLVRKVSAGKK